MVGPPRGAGGGRRAHRQGRRLLRPLRSPVGVLPLPALLGGRSRRRHGGGHPGGLLVAPSDRLRRRRMEARAGAGAHQVQVRLRRSCHPGTPCLRMPVKGEEDGGGEGYFLSHLMSHRDVPLLIVTVSSVFYYPKHLLVLTRRAI